jgi:hypothetical protein
MAKYKVRVKVTSYVTVVVEASGEKDALDKAAYDARFSHASTFNKVYEADKVLFIAKEGHPCVQVPSDWQIYSDMPGAEAANAAITEAATKLGDHLVKAKKDLSTAVIKEAVQKVVSPVFKTYRRFGTGDTEPRDLMANFVAAFSKGLDDDLSYPKVFEATANTI